MPEITRFYGIVIRRYFAEHNPPLGRRKNVTQELWIASTDVARSPGHPFYEALNKLLREGAFDRWVEKRCAAYCAKCGRPGIRPVSNLG